MITEELRKAGTEYLGECWHEIVIGCGGVFSCRKCGYTPDDIDDTNKNRTFTTWQDFGDLKEKILDKGDWNEFEDYCYLIYNEGFGLNKYRSLRFSVWLISLDRIPLMLEWIEKKGKETQLTCKLQS
jgi:hypothetical protein